MIFVFHLYFIRLEKNLFYKYKNFKDFYVIISSLILKREFLFSLSDQQNGKMIIVNGHNFGYKFIKLSFLNIAKYYIDTVTKIFLLKIIYFCNFYKRTKFWLRRVKILCLT